MAKMQPQRRSQQNACTIMKYYEGYFDIIRDIFKNENIPSSYYSFFECVEGAVCIILVDYNEWHICNIDRGNKYREKTFSTIIEVCYEMISRISDDSEQEISMKTLFNKQILEKQLLNDHISFLTAEIRKKRLSIQWNNSIKNDLEKMNIQRTLLLRCLKKCEASYHNKGRKSNKRVVIQNPDDEEYVVEYGKKIEELLIELRKSHDDKIRVEVMQEVIGNLKGTEMPNQELVSGVRKYFRHFGVSEKNTNTERISQIEEKNETYTES